MISFVSIESKRFKIKPYPLCLGNTLKDFTINNIKKTGLNGYAYVFSTDYNIIDTNNILDIDKHLMKIT